MRADWPRTRKRQTRGARDASPRPSARDAALFHTLKTSLTVSVYSWLQGRDASESMEVLSTLTIGNNVLRARVQGTQEQLVVTIATGRLVVRPQQRTALGKREGKEPASASGRFLELSIKSRPSISVVRPSHGRHNFGFQSCGSEKESSGSARRESCVIRLNWEEAIDVEFSQRG